MDMLEGLLFCLLAVSITGHHLFRIRDLAPAGVT